MILPHIVKNALTNAQGRQPYISSSAKSQIDVMGQMFSESRMLNQYGFLKSGMDVVYHGPETFG